MGIPFYGRYWKNVGEAADIADPMWRIARQVDGEFEGGALPWRDIPSRWNMQLVQYHEKAKAPFIWDRARSMFLGFEDPRSIQEKVRWYYCNRQ
jgi:GH18 family chitinase